MICQSYLTLLLFLHGIDHCYFIIHYFCNWSFAIRRFHILSIRIFLLLMISKFKIEFHCSTAYSKKCCNAVVPTTESSFFHLGILIFCHICSFKLSIIFVDNFSKFDLYFTVVLPTVCEYVATL
jgi:hypothetical protein